MIKESNTLRLGIAGLGAMGYPHVGFALNVPEVVLTAICDVDPAKIARVRESHYSVAPKTSSGGTAADSVTSPPFPAVFDKPEDMISSGLIDAVLIAVPHFGHEAIAGHAFAKGIHVLCEKPLAVTVQSARRMIAAWEQGKKNKPSLVFGAMFMQRTWGQWKKIKSMIDDGELGAVVRATWIVTDWFRTQHYYSQGGWRGTWNGEGGGVLTNQSPHNLDLLQWFLGMPDQINAFGGLGKHHKIAVEDEVSAVLQYSGGVVAHFVTSTGESPGTNRLEIVGENGKLIFENGQLTFHRNRSSMKVWSDTSDQAFGGPEYEILPVPFTHHGESGHRLVLQNFARNILLGETLVATGPEAINQVILTNAMMVSLLEGGRAVRTGQAGDFEKLLSGLKKQETKR